MAPSERVKGWHAGAQTGRAEDQYQLARCYSSSGTEGLTENKWMAAQLYGKAAERGHAAAQVNLGLMYVKDEGVEQNLELAVSWYREAANQGHPGGQNCLAEMYRYGKGVEQNLELGMSWY